MRTAVLFLLVALFFGCTQRMPASELPVSGDGEVVLVAGENYSTGEPIAFQIKTSNYSIAFLNRSGGYSIGTYPSFWICRKGDNGSCKNIEYRRMRDFSVCGLEGQIVNVPEESREEYNILPAEYYDLLLLWNQMEWKEEKVPCMRGEASMRTLVRVPKGNYSATFVYWVSWEREPRSVTVDFRII